MKIKSTNIPSGFESIDLNRSIDGVEIKLDFHGTNLDKKLLNYTFIAKFDSKTESKEFSLKYREICGMPFTPYNYKTQEFNFYTSKYTPQDFNKRVEILNSLISLCEEQAKLNLEDSISAKNYFENNFKNLGVFEGDGVLCVPVASQKSIFAIPTKFLGTNEYAKLRKLSSDFKKMTDFPVEVVDEIKALTGDKIKPNSNAFIIGEELIEKFVNQITKEEDAKVVFKDEQVKIGKNLNLEDYEITYKNPFDLKIKYDKDNGYFDFYCKGYNDSLTPFGEMNPRNLLGKWALNFILSTEDENWATAKFYKELSPTEKYKINLKHLSGSSARDKSLLIPAEQHERIKLIFDNYQTQKNLWEREPSEVKLPFRSLGLEQNADFYPFIHFKEDGQALFVYNVRHSNVKSKSAFVKMIGFNISKEEVDEYLFNHPFSKDILAGSKYAMGCLNDSKTISDKENEEMFHKAYEAYKLRNELVTNLAPKRKFKI